MKIYTRQGDKGFTFLFGGGPYPKDHPAIEAYGSVDELNSVLGCALTQIQENDLALVLITVQKELFVVGSELASVQPSETLKKGFLTDTHVEQLEKWIDQFEEELLPLANFLLPGGSPSSAFLHWARTVCRRVERHLVALSKLEILRLELIRYLNRLSDLLFVMARVANRRAGVKDQLWDGLLRKPSE